jgi:hypothetical protein
MTPSPQSAVRPAARLLCAPNSAAGMIKVQALKVSAAVSGQPPGLRFRGRSRGQLRSSCLPDRAGGICRLSEELFSAAKEAPPDQQKSRTQNTENDGTAARGSRGRPCGRAAFAGRTGKRRCRQFRQCRADDCATDRHLDMVDSFLASIHPLIFSQSKSGPAARSISAWPPMTINRRRPYRAAKEEIKKIGVGGGGGEAEEPGCCPAGSATG